MKSNGKCRMEIAALLNATPVRSVFTICLALMLASSAHAANV